MINDIEQKVLKALFLMSKDKCNGVHKQRFIEESLGTAWGAEQLVNRKYARRLNNEHGFFSYYCLTPEGINYLDEIIRFASEKF